MSESKATILHCDFCGKSQHDVKKLIAGPVGRAGPVCICDECVLLSLDIIGEEARTDGERPLSHEELRLRDQFAGQALPESMTNTSNPTAAAKQAFEQADAMLKARRT